MFCRHPHLYQSQNLESSYMIRDNLESYTTEKGSSFFPLKGFPKLHEQANNKNIGRTARNLKIQRENKSYNISIDTVEQWISSQLIHITVVSLMRHSSLYSAPEIKRKIQLQINRNKYIKGLLCERKFSSEEFATFQTKVWYTTFCSLNKNKSYKYIHITSCFMVPASRKQLVTVCCALQPWRRSRRGRTEPTMAGEPFALLLGKPLEFIWCQ